MGQATILQYSSTRVRTSARVYNINNLSRNGFQDLSWKSVACGWKFVRASVRASVRPYVRLSTFSEFLLLSCAKALQCP
jgi:hypothetical protein